MSAYAALRKESGDALVERVTGQSQAQDVPVEAHVVIDADTLLGETDEPGHLDG